MDSGVSVPAKNVDEGDSPMKSYVAKKPTESSKRTRHAIGRTFLDIAAEVPFNKVSVREICKRMGITRTAFYYHFDDVYAVLDGILENMAVECCIDDLCIAWADGHIGGLDIPCKAAMDRIHLFTAANECGCLLNDVMLAGYLIDYIIKRETEYVASRFADDSGLSEAEAEQLFRFTFAGTASLYCGRRQEKRLADVPVIYPKRSVLQRRYST